MLTHCFPLSELPALVLEAEAVYRQEVVHQHGYWEILFFPEGGCVHFIDGKKYTPTTQEVHLVAKDSTHLLKIPCHPQPYLIAVSHFFITQLELLNPHLNCRAAFKNSRVCRLNSADAKGFATLFAGVVAGNFSAACAVSLIRALCLATICKEGAPLTALQQALPAAIEGHFRKHLSSKAYAKLLYTTEVTLNRKAMALWGKTVQQMQTERLLREALLLLQSGTLTVGTVAEVLGFKSQAYFGHWFHHLTGKAPGMFRGK